MNHVYGLMKYVDQWFAVHLWRPGDQAKIEIQFWTPRSFPKDEMTAECDVHFFAWFISGFNHKKLPFCELR